MNKLLLQITFIFCILIISCTQFDGNISSSEDCFKMDYTIFNQQKTGFFKLVEGDSVLVSILQEKGFIDVTVALPGKEPIYEGHKLSNTKFTLNIHESGTYQITVNGHNASGSVIIEKLK